MSKTEAIVVGVVVWVGLIALVIGMTMSAKKGDEDL